MSRSEHAQTRSFGTLAQQAAIGCMLVLVAGCRFSTNPGDTLIAPDAGEPMRATEEVETAVAPTGASTRTTATIDARSESLDAGVISDDSAKPGQTPAPAGSPAPASPPSAGAPGPQSQPSAAVSGAPAARPSAAGSGMPVAQPSTAGSAAPVSQPSAAGGPAIADAGTPDTPAADAGAPHSTSDTQCSAELADCLVRDPLDYAECLRANQENGCPEPDSGVATTSPVTTEDGKPLSQACQAELASCIMRLPTPENAASCTEKARKCT